ncbi:MAG TPA: zf-HC2 domain-containing protein, partial [Candidatus Limnocylindrales bacterium]|nr:zf-HC2 domain-containing protein [Candidatus Limnocylindrales bacterium]
MHERARALAAERLDGVLAVPDRAWLDAHLAECPPCRAVAEGYVADRELLRGLATPRPPRDLWAATASRLDAERPPRGRGRPVRSMPLGALAGVLVVAVVVGAAWLTDRPGQPAAASPSTALASSDLTPVTAAASPLHVEREIGLLRREGGLLGVSVATVDQVCATTSLRRCQVATAGRDSIAVSEQAKSVVKSPNGKLLAVVLSDDNPGVVIVPAPSDSSLAASGPPASPGALASPTPFATPTRSVTPTPTALQTETPPPSPS